MMELTNTKSYRNPDFTNTGKAFLLKTDSGLRRARFLFRMLRYGTMMRMAGTATRVALALRLPVTFIIRKLVFNHFCGGESLEASMPVVRKLQGVGVGSIPDYSAEGKSDEASFDRVCREVMATIELASEDPGVTHAVFKPSGIAPFALWEKMSKGVLNDSKDLSMVKMLESRMDRIMSLADKHNVAVMVDAEETWIQPAIDDLIRRFSARYNRGRVILFNTLQMYRTDRLAFLADETRKAEEGGYCLGYKLVRGAYHEQEMERALKRGYTMPVYTVKSDTDQAYNDAIRFCYKHRNIISSCVATHNEESVKVMVELMMSDPEKGGFPVFFSQLYGMSDHITFNLADAGFSVSKYLPYGPLREVIPYLLRRAEENRSVGGQTGRELTILERELLRRRQDFEGAQRM